MVKLLPVILAFFLIAGAARAEDGAPALKEWTQKALKKYRGGAYPRKIAFVKGFGAKGEPPKFLDITPDEFHGVSYLAAADTRSALWDFKLNQDKFAGLDPKELVFALTGADTVLVAAETGDWELLRKVAGKIASVGKRARAKTATPPVLAYWLVTTLGWDGVVIDRSGEYLLVGSSAAILKTPEIQALAVADSEKKIVLTAAERKGAGLLSLSESDAGYGTFDIVFLGQGVKELPPGTKLIIEKKGQGK